MWATMFSNIIACACGAIKFVTHGPKYVYINYLSQRNVSLSIVNMLFWIFCFNLGYIYCCFFQIHALLLSSRALYAFCSAGNQNQGILILEYTFIGNKLSKLNTY